MFQSHSCLKLLHKIEEIFNIPIGYFGETYRLEIIPSGTKINPSEILFPKIEDEQVQAQIEKLNKSKQDKNRDSETNSE
jgi:hypothetical protein